MKLWPMKRNWESEYDVGGKVVIVNIVVESWWPDLFKDDIFVQGRVFEMPDQGLSSAAKSGGPKMRPKTGSGSATTGRPRPKTIHISSGSTSDLSRTTSNLVASKGKRGSSTNLAGKPFTVPRTSSLTIETNSTSAHAVLISYCKRG